MKLAIGTRRYEDEEDIVGKPAMICLFVVTVLLWLFQVIVEMKQIIATCRTKGCCAHFTESAWNIIDLLGLILV